MSLSRSIRMLVACLAAFGLLSGCSFGEATHAKLGDSGFELEGTLEVLSGTQLELLPGDTAELEVRYVPHEGSAAAGVPVEFALLASADKVEAPPTDEEDRSDDGAALPSASLTPAKPLTDADGVARVVLTVGSKEGHFRVRAWAAGTEPVFVDVRVGPAVRPVLWVTVAYDGLREIATRSATALPSMTCAQAMEAESYSEEVRVAEAGDEALRFELGGGLRYAVLAWGRDATNAALARGCHEYQALVTGDSEQAEGMLTVHLEDVPLRVIGSYELAFEMDLKVPSARLAEVVRTQGEALALTGAPAGAAAQAYLDALERVVRTRNGKDQEVRAAREDGTLDAASLEATLFEQDAGLVPAADVLASLLSAAGARLTGKASYGVGAQDSVPMTFSIASLAPASETGTPSASFDGVTGYMLPAATMLAQYDDARAVIDVSALRIELGLGSYGRTLLEALGTGDTSWLANHLGDAAGCEAVEAWIAAQSALDDLCDATCAALVCPETLVALVSRVRDAFVSLDGPHPAISLRGALAARDRRDRDGLVDDLGPSTLSGNWGQAYEAESADAVSAVLRTPRPEPVLGL